MKFLTEVLATFFGCGYVPKIPGTAASIVTAFLVLVTIKKIPLTSYLAVLAVVMVVGIVAASAYDRMHKTHDASQIVIDEVAGQMLTLLPVVVLSAHFLIAAVVIGLGLFRFFDIKKPLGVYQLQALPTGWGVMADDILAGIYSAILLGGLIWIGL